MNHIIFITILSILCNSVFADDTSHSCFTKNAVIIGASYSSSSRQPPYRAIKATGNEPLRNIAVPLAGSPEQMNSLEKFKRSNDVGTIFALDLFYWKTGENCSTAISHAKELMDWAKNDKVLFLGTLPLQALNLECIKRLNTLIRNQCKVPNCITIDYAKWVDDLEAGQLTVDGEKVSKNILDHTRHLNSYGQKMAAGKILETLRNIDPKLCPRLNNNIQSPAVDEFIYETEEVDVSS